MVMVLYPENGVSPVQKALMTSVEGSNVHVVGKCYTFLGSSKNKLPDF